MKVTRNHTDQFPTYCSSCGMKVGREHLESCHYVEKAMKDDKITNCEFCNKEIIAKEIDNHWCEGKIAYTMKGIGERFHTSELKIKGFEDQQLERQVSDTRSWLGEVENRVGEVESGKVVDSSLPRQVQMLWEWSQDFMQPRIKNLDKLTSHIEVLERGLEELIDRVQKLELAHRCEGCEDLHAAHESGCPVAYADNLHTQQLKSLAKLEAKVNSFRAEDVEWSNVTDKEMIDLKDRMRRLEGGAGGVPSLKEHSELSAKVATLEISIRQLREDQFDTKINQKINSNVTKDEPCLCGGQRGFHHDDCPVRTGRSPSLAKKLEQPHNHKPDEVCWSSCPGYTGLVKAGDFTVLEKAIVEAAKHLFTSDEYSEMDIFRALTGLSELARPERGKITLKTQLLRG